MASAINSPFVTSHAPGSSQNARRALTMPNAPLPRLEMTLRFVSCGPWIPISRVLSR